VTEPPLERQIEIVRALLALRRAGRLPALWVEQSRILLDAGYGCRQRITWDQARRLAAGEPLEDVLSAPGLASKLEPRPQDWRHRRSVYLAAVRRVRRRVA
jgi:hypothetical protein